MKKNITLSPGGKIIPCEDGQTVLAALEKQGYVLPNNCRAGACGECKTRVLKGKYDQGFILDMALSKEEREKGMGLMCMAKPLEDLEIEFDSNSNLPKLYPPQENLPFIVTEKVPATPRIVKLRLRSLGAPMKFWPGQFITLGSVDEGIPYRSYSVANGPNLDGEIVLLVTKVEGGKTSEWVHDKLKVGTVVKVNGPYGTFVGNPQSELPVLCLASGSGLAPIMSLASAALLRGGFRNPATVLFSARTEEEIMERGLFRFLETKFRNFRFMATLTREEKVGYLKGRIPEILPTMFSDLSYMSVYIAGSPEFVEDCKKVVLSLGVRPDQIYLEAFVPGPY